MREQRQIKRQVGEMQQKLAKTEHKAESIGNYCRWDHAIFGGIPYSPGIDGLENCKQIIVNVCRELHYNIPINEISTAHRLKQHANSSRPPNIVVRFKDRDIRNDVLRLKSVLKEKRYWKNYNIQRLYINEQLTPEKNKLMYQTKIFTREMYRIHGKIFVWSFKGEIYLRKAIEHAPKRKIDSEQDLNDLRRGTISLDPTFRSRHTRYTTSHANTDAVVESLPPRFSLQEYPLPA